MTVENQRNKKRFQGDGVTDAVTFSFRVLSIEDIKVYVYPEDLEFDDLEDFLVDPNDYTVTLDDDGEGGEVLFDPGAIPASDEIGLILNALELTQTADLPTEGNFNEEGVETALDRTVLQNIQQQERVNRGLALRVEDPLADDDFEGFYIQAVQPGDRAGRIMLFNATGDGVEAGLLASDLSGLEGISAEIAIVAGIADEVVAVSGYLTPITTVAGSIDNVNAVGSNIGSVTIAAANIADINTTAANIADINTTASNIAAIIAAPGYATAAADSATLAQAWAVNPEYVAVPGYPGQYSAFHWAAKAMAAAGGGLVKISSNDTTADYLSAKLTTPAGGGIALTENDNGSNETLAVTLDMGTLQSISSILASNQIIIYAGDNHRRTSLENAFKAVNGFTEDTTPDLSDDFIPIYDTSAGAIKKVKPSNIAPAGIPVGTSIEFNGSTPPTGYLEENGAAVSRSTYAALFAVIGTTFGVGDGSTTFNIPDSRRRTAVGAGGTGTGTLGNAVGNTGGAETHSLTSSENGPHTHAFTNSSVSDGGSGAAANRVTQQTGLETVTTSSSGSGTAHNNIQPSIVKMKCIKY